MDIKDYIKELGIYHYAETYSFRRGEEFLELRQAYQEQRDRLSRREEKGKEISDEELVYLLSLRKEVSIPLYILDENNQLNPTAVKMATMKSGDEWLVRFEQILTDNQGERNAWMCPPEYRDAIIFYDESDAIVSALNICFSCDHLKAETGELDAAADTFEQLRNLFVSIGHNINQQ